MLALIRIAVVDLVRPCTASTTTQDQHCLIASCFNTGASICGGVISSSNQLKLGVLLADLAVLLQV